MKTVKTSWNLGNFTVALEAQVTPEQEEILLSRGLLHAAQRVSEVDFALGIAYKDGKKTVRKDGKDGRPKVTRNDVPYSDTLRDKLAEVFTGIEIAEAKGTAPAVTLATTPVITVYDRDDSTSKEARDMALRSISAHESAGDLEEWLAVKADYSGPTHTDDGENYHPDAIAAVIPLARARIAEIKAQAKVVNL